MNVYPWSDPICVSYRRISLLTVSMPGVLSLTPRSALTSGPEGLSTSPLAVERLSSRAGPLSRALIAEGPASEERLAHDEPSQVALKTVSMVMRGGTWEMMTPHRGFRGRAGVGYGSLSLGALCLSTKRISRSGGRVDKSTYILRQLPTDQGAAFTFT